MKTKKAAGKENRAGSSLVPLERIMWFHRQVSAEVFPNATTLARNFGVSKRTAQRDIDFMRDRLNLPLEYDGDMRGYRYTQYVTEMPGLQFSRDEVLAIIVAERALQEYPSTPFREAAGSALRKLLTGIGGQLPFSVRDFRNAVSFKIAPGNPAATEHFRLLAMAIIARKEVTFTYQRPNRDPERKVVRPYHLFCNHGTWYLVGEYPGYVNDFRTFSLNRMHDVAQTETTFERVPDFEPEQMWKSQFGVWGGGRTETVRVWFDNFSAPYIRERFAPMQHVETPDEKGVTIEFQHEVHSDLVGWILSWGEHAKVLGPASLVSAMAASARGMAAHYATPPESAVP